MITRRNRLWFYVAILIAHNATTFAAESDGPRSAGNTVSGVITILDRKGDKVADRSDAVVFLDGHHFELNSPLLADVPAMSHKGRQFSPRVLPIVAGSSVDFLNDDSIYHNVFSLSKAKIFDLGIYAEGTSKLVTFDAPGLVKIFCNIHPNMVSNVLVLRNHLFAKTDTTGRYEIHDIPDGIYVLRVWSELAEDAQREVTLTERQDNEYNFTLVRNKRVRQHKNKFGRPYKQKY